VDSIAKITEEIKQFRDQRDWLQFHDPKNMAVSIMLEASELLEHFQWKTKSEVKEYIQSNRESVQEEIADISMYLFELADNLGIDLLEAMEKKLKKNADKYPAAKAKGSHKKYNQL